ncbi:MAG: FKBP-type peptidyl-prolyl cis-trans isomerase, partial [Bacteroidia bacterium]|nr:FKBP-type peptidyl-prolyl cis-trans isomerase [Bacteroidia bacterium]
VPPTIPPKSTLIFFIEVLSKQMPFQPYTHDTKKRIKKESGLEYAIIEQGNGTAITPSSKVSLHYNARLSNGVILGNTFDKGEPLVVIMGKNQLFKGWEEGLSYLKQGDKATLIIPPHLGPDVGTNIPKEESIIIDLEILSVEPYEQFKPYKYEHLPFQESPSGVPFYLVEKGNGPLPKIGEFVKMHYHGVIRNKNGERFFDSTFERGKPATLLLGNSEALRAWDEILPLVPKGSKIVMTLTPEKISQEKNLPPIIGTDSILIFYIYLLE